MGAADPFRLGAPQLHTCRRRLSVREPTGPASFLASSVVVKTALSVEPPPIANGCRGEGVIVNHTNNWESAMLQPSDKVCGMAASKPVQVSLGAGLSQSSIRR